MADKIAISVDPDLLERVEELRKKTKESRSAVFARAARLLLDNEEHRRKVERYVEAHRQHPETARDMARAAALAKISLASLEWED